MHVGGAYICMQAGMTHGPLLTVAYSFIHSEHYCRYYSSYWAGLQWAFHNRIIQEPHPQIQLRIVLLDTSDHSIFASDSLTTLPINQSQQQYRYRLLVTREFSSGRGCGRFITIYIIYIKLLLETKFDRRKDQQ